MMIVVVGEPAIVWSRQDFLMDVSFSEQYSLAIFNFNNEYFLIFNISLSHPHCTDFRYILMKKDVRLQKVRHRHKFDNLKNFFKIKHCSQDIVLFF